jgi:N-acetylmuramoyl-L-alanine amidase
MMIIFNKKLMRSGLVLLVTSLFLTTNAFAQRKMQTIIIDAGHGYKGPNKTSPDGAPGILCNEDDVALAVSLKLGDLIKKKYPDLKIVQTRKDDNFISLGTRSTIANNNKGDLFICIHVNDSDTRKEKVVDSFKVVDKVKYEKDSTGEKVPVHYEEQVPVYKWQRVGCSAFGAQSYIWIPRNNTSKINAVKGTMDIEEDSTSAEISAIEAALYVKKYFKKSVDFSEMVIDEFDKIGRKFGSKDNKGIYQRPKGIHVLERTAMPSVLIETGFICNDKDEAYLCSVAGQTELAETILKAFTRYKEKVETPMQTRSDNNRATTEEQPQPTTGQIPLASIKK